MNPNNNRKYWQIFAGVLVLVIVIMIFSFRAFNQDIANLAAVGQVGDGGSTGTITAPVELRVTEQFPSPFVIVSTLDLPSAAWVVITEAIDNIPGAIGGFAYFDENDKSGVIDLSIPTIEGRTYFAGLYHDNGDRRFISTEDEKWLGENNQPIMVKFLVTRDLPEIKG